MPSCIRAPPLAAKRIRGSLFFPAYSMASVSFSPTAALMLPMRKRLSSTPTTQRLPPMVPVAVTTASFIPVLRRAPVQLGPVAGEAEGVIGRSAFHAAPGRMPGSSTLLSR